MSNNSYNYNMQINLLDLSLYPELIEKQVYLIKSLYDDYTDTEDLMGFGDAKLSKDEELYIKNYRKIENMSTEKAVLPSKTYIDNLFVFIKNSTPHERAILLTHLFYRSAIKAGSLYEKNAANASNKTQLKSTIKYISTIDKISIDVPSEHTIAFNKGLEFLAEMETETGIDFYKELNKSIKTIKQIDTSGLHSSTADLTMLKNMVDTTILAGNSIGKWLEQKLLNAAQQEAADRRENDRLERERRRAEKKAEQTREYTEEEWAEWRSQQNADEYAGDDNDYAGYDSYTKERW